MAKTIIQSIGPLYGEVVNGTVFGRPNGSIFVPTVNTISASIPDEYVTPLVYGGKTYAIICRSNGVRAGSVISVAESQDIANYMSWELADNADFTDSVGKNYAAGQFNVSDSSVGVLPDSFVIAEGTTYYLRAVLNASTGVPVAYSSTFTLTGVVNE